MSAKRTWVDMHIEENMNILLASFGLEGLQKSSLKEKIVVDIINSMTGKTIDNITLFYDEMLEYYMQDHQFKRFRVSEINKFIAEERSYITLRMLA